MIKTLDEKKIIAACEKLSKQDEDLKFIYEKYAAPPLWKREASFATLLHIILEQQVSLASALSAFNKLREKSDGAITPENVLKLSDTEMKAAYFSRQKTVYARDLAGKIMEGKLDLENLKNLSDEDRDDWLYGNLITKALPKVLQMIKKPRPNELKRSNRTTK